MLDVGDGDDAGGDVVGGNEVGEGIGEAVGETLGVGEGAKVVEGEGEDNGIFPVFVIESAAK